MEPCQIELEAGSLADLQQALTQLTSQPQPLPHKIAIHTQGWYPTYWELSITGVCDLSSIHIELNSLAGAIESLITPLESNARSHRLRIEPIWPCSVLPNQQTITISTIEQAAFCTGIDATDQPSPWQLMQLLRLDITQHNFNGMLFWLCVHGFTELNILRQSMGLIHRLNDYPPGSKHRYYAYLTLQRPDIREAFGDGQSSGFQHWLKTHAPVDCEWPAMTPSGALSSERIRVRAWNERPYGVNLFGYAREVLGIGEDLRTCVEALETVGVPVNIVDIPTQATTADLRREARESPDDLAPYAFNLFCLTAEEHARVLMELGSSVMEQRYNIGYWPWELSRWPKAWQPLLAMVDEVWASSRFTEQTVAAAIGNLPSPLLRRFALPLQKLEPQTRVEREYWRRRYGLPEAAPLVICSIDGRSSYARKNPWGSINAFLEAMSAEDQSHHTPHLVIKTLHGGLDPKNWQRLTSLAETEPRLHIIDAVLPREQLLGLYGCCDVLLSLHRAEGYGRVLAEALVLGLKVVATDYSGNRDFCVGPQVHPVTYTLNPVGKDDYFHGENQHWAEPDHDHAVQQLKAALAELGVSQSPTDTYALLFSARACGQRYHQRLQEIASAVSTAKILRWA